MDNKIDFIGAGLPRSATTWVSKCFEEHPKILFSSQKIRKEINFFNNDYRYSKGIDWYINHFPKSQKDKIRGEFSPLYWLSAKAAKRIHKHFPQIKLLFIIRNPIDRVYSLYWQKKSAIRYWVREKFKDQVLKKDFKHSYFNNGFYYQRLKVYFDIFPKKNIHIATYRQIKDNPEKALKEIFKFLDVDSNFTPNSVYKKVNKTKQSRFPLFDYFCYKILDILKQLKLYKIRKFLLNQYKFYDYFNKVNRKSVNYPSLSTKTKRILKEYYANDVSKTESLINKKIF